MRKLLPITLSTALLLLLLAATARAVTPWTLLVNTSNVIVATNASYGAVGNGIITNTTAIQAAINQAAKGAQTNGLSGGTVEIPGPGIYLCGPLTMANYVNLQVDAGAILRMLPINQYPGGDVSPANFINGSSLHDIEVSGPGAIDGQGSPWWQDSNTNAAANRPIMINFDSCTRMLIQNITLSNSPEFHMAIGGSGGSKTVSGVVVNAPSSEDPVNPSHNTDACDVGGTNILVQNCNISTGDDDFTCGGGTFDVLLTNNVYGNGHGVSVGSYTDGGVSNITVINCSFTGTDNGIRLKSERGRGGLIQNLTYCNLAMTNVGWPLLVYSYYEYGLGTLTSVDPTFAANVAATNATTLNSTTPVWQNITFSNISATMPAGRPPLMIWGLPEAPASNIVFRAVNITSSSTLPPEVLNATNIQFVDCSFNVPASVNTLQFGNAGLIFTNSADSVAATNLWRLNGLTTNGMGNGLQFYNARGTLKNTNALAAGPLTLSASTFTVSNSLSLAPNTVLNFVAGTNPVTLAVTGGLTLGGTNNIYAGPGFTNGTYPLMTYAGTLSGSLPVPGVVPGGYSYQFDTNTVGIVKLVVSVTVAAPSAPASLSATAADTMIVLNWSPSLTATNYNLKRATVSGGSYATIASLTGTNYTDLQVTNGRTYYYIVTASNAGGASANSAEASATPEGTVFSDTFADSSLNATASSMPTASATSYELLSSKSWSPTPTLAAGHLKFGIAATSSGVMEAQALFTSSPVTLTTVGDSVSLAVTFTNTTGLLAQSGAMGFGLYNSGQHSPVPGGLNSTAVSGSTGNATGNAQTWVGYVGQLAFTNASSQILTRLVQSGAGNNNQELVTSGSSSSSYFNPGGTTVGTASSTAAVTLPTNSAYTEVLTITLSAANTLAISNSLYSGPNTGGTLLSQFGATASGANYLTNSFDALAFGWRATTTNEPTMLDVNQITVSSGVASAPVAPPAAPTGLMAVPGNAQVGLNWTASSGAVSYNVKRALVSGGSYTTITNVTATGYTDTNVVNGTPYYYVVSALNAGGESTNSAEAVATPQVPAPAAPDGFSASPTNLLIVLNWNAVPEATTYNLKRGTTSGGPYPTVFSSLTQTNFTDASVTNAVTYYYVVTASGPGGESTNSLPVNAMTLPSKQPASVSLQVNGGQLQLSWPQDHQGWLLQMQTNDLSGGLGTNWVTVPNSGSIDSTNLSINPTGGSVFFRIIYP